MLSREGCSIVKGVLNQFLSRCTIREMVTAVRWERVK